MPAPFSPEAKPINELFGRDITYVIPDYQRPYSWQCLGKSDKNNQVNVMWNDLFKFFKDGSGQINKDYFFGSIVLIDKAVKGQQLFEVIDGQQRLTTTVLLFVAIKSFLTEINPSVTDPNVTSFITNAIAFIDELVYNKKLIGALVSDKKLKIERTTDFDYDAILNEVVDGADEPSAKVLKNANIEQKGIIKRYFDNRKFFKEKINEEFTVKGKFTMKEATSLNEFIDCIKNKVSVVRILTWDFNIAYHVFEILNNRGLPLSNKDLFRNFIIREFDKLKIINTARYKDLSPTEKWNALEDDTELSDDFIGRWVESYKATQQKSSAFNDLKEIYEHNYVDTATKCKIELFYEDIKRDLNYYTEIVNNTFDNPIIKAKVNFILNAPNLRYGLNFLLALSKNVGGLDEKSKSAFIINLVKEYELHLMNTLLVDRYSYSPVYTCIDFLNNKDSKRALAAFTKEYNKSKIKNALSADIIDNDVAKLLLAKYLWIHESETNDDVVLQELDYDKATLEHIIPQIPAKNTNWLRDFSSSFRKNNTYMLGNMTLLTSKMNSSAKNSDFKDKKVQYAKTKLKMTVQIHSINHITEQYITKRHKEIVDAICKDLGI